VTPISCVGSSGVKPFAEALANKFQIDHKNIDVTVEAGGSGFGISQVAHGFTDIGNASKNPFSTVRDNYQNEWEQQRIKTVTIG
jgi:phosphate transport system substrate-binding protein